MPPDAFVNALRHVHNKILCMASAAHAKLHRAHCIAAPHQGLIGAMQGDADKNSIQLISADELGSKPKLQPQFGRRSLLQVSHMQPLMTASFSESCCMWALIMLTPGAGQLSKCLQLCHLDDIFTALQIPRAGSTRPHAHLLCRLRNVVMASSQASQQSDQHML